MSSNFDKLLEYIQKQIDDKRFYEAHQSIQNYQKTARNIDILYQPTIQPGLTPLSKKDYIEEMQQLPKKLREAIEVVFEEFNSKQQDDDSVLEEIIKKSPKEIIENIQKILDDDDLKEFADKIILKIGPIFVDKIQVLYDRVGKQVEKGKGPEILYKINSYFKMCGQLPTCLNKQYKLLIQLQNIKNKYENEQKAESLIIKKFIEDKKENIQDVYFKINDSVYSLDQKCKETFNVFYQDACIKEQNKLEGQSIDGFQSKLYQLWLFQSSESVKSQLDQSSNKSYKDLAQAIQDVYSQIIKRFIAIFQNKSTDSTVQIEIFDHKIIHFDISKIKAFNQFFEKADHFKCANEVIENAGEKLKEVIEIASQMIEEISIKFSSLLKNDDPKKLCDIFQIIVFMRNIKTTQELLAGTEFNQILKLQNKYDESLFNNFKNSSKDINYPNLCKQLVEKYQALIQKYNKPQFFQYDDTSLDLQLQSRKEYYEDLEKYIRFVQESQIIYKDLLDCEFDIQIIQKNWIDVILAFNVKLKNEAIKQLKTLMGQNQLLEIKRLLDVLQLTQESFNLIIVNDFSTVIQEGITSMKTKAGFIIENISKKQEGPKQQSELAQIISDFLIQSQTISIDIKQLKVQANKIIKETLDNLQKQTKDQGIITEIAMSLKKSAIGSKIIEEQEFFIQEARKLWATKISKQDIDYVLTNLEKNDNQKLSQNEISNLKKQYTNFDECYTKLVENSIVPYNDIPDKKEDLKRKLRNLTQTQKNDKITFAAKEKLCLILAHLFAIWTLQDFYKNKFNCDAQKDLKAVQFILKPHPAQLISIFRMFGIGYDNVVAQNQDSLTQQKKDQLKKFVDKNGVFDNLVQIKTGEGKSITLAMVICVFAMWDFDVSCACYSDYLSQRDKNSFKDLFEFLNISDKIYYGTFNQISERYINKDGDIRELTLNRILKDYRINNKDKDSVEKRVILIDEVDVFFSKEFFNMSYVPVAKIKHEKISNLLDYVWEQRDEKITPFKKLKESKQYNECAALFKPEYLGVFEEACKDIFGASREFKHDYIVQNGKIGYKVMDQVSFTKSEGYKTIFAHYHHYKPPEKEEIKDDNNNNKPAEKQEIKESVNKISLEDCKSLEICCGQFSYAEIPLYSMLILGVTGTLQSLSESEKEIIKNIFQIRNFTYTPSVYGQSKLQWALADKHQRTLILSKADYYNCLKDEITGKLQANGDFRAVIVFFKTSELLNQFKNSDQWQLLKCSKQQVLTELDNLPDEEQKDDSSQNEPQIGQSEKDNKITKATFQDTVTLATRSFGRGTDFICRDEVVETNGGVHVILTFVPEMNSEFVQIQGRTARQGNKGSFQMILLDESLTTFNVYVDSKGYLDEKNDKLDYVLKQRDIYMKEKQNSDSSAITLTRSRHNESLNTQEILVNNDGSKSKELNQYLIKINAGPLIDETLNPVKTLILMDATGSMGSFLNAAKNSVNQMYERSGQIMKEKGFDPSLNMIQFACYRNYNSSEDLILQYSPWECRSDRLKSFMDPITVSGGWGNEAVEVGFQHAVQEVQNCEVRKGKKWFQVYLIGDAPPNTQLEVDEKRKQFKFSSRNSKFSSRVYWETELDKLKASQIPVNGFYVATHAKSSFEEIANRTGGNCEYLDLSKPNSQETLLKLFSTNILKMIGAANGDVSIGKKMEDEYLRRYTS